MSFFEFPHTRTYDSDLGWLIRQCKTNQDAIAALETWKADAQGSIDDIKQLYADIISGNFPEEMADAIKYATIIVSTLPILCLYPFLQQYFTKGVMVGSVKG